MDRIEKAKDFLTKMYNESEYLNNNLSQKNYRFEHTLRVSKWGEKIAIDEGLDIDALVVGCLLHDISYIEEIDSEEKAINHGRRSAEIVGDFLNELDFDLDTKNDILHGIAIHVDGKSAKEWRNSVLASSIGDADNLDRFDAYRIYEFLQFNNYSEMNIAEKEKFCIERIAKINENLKVDFSTTFATRIFHSELRFMLGFYTKLYNQCLNSY